MSTSVVRRTWIEKKYYNGICIGTTWEIYGTIYTVVSPEEYKMSRRTAQANDSTIIYVRDGTGQYNFGPIGNFLNGRYKQVT